MVKNIKNRLNIYSKYEKNKVSQKLNQIKLGPLLLLKKVFVYFSTKIYFFTLKSHRYLFFLEKLVKKS